MVSISNAEWQELYGLDTTVILAAGRFQIKLANTHKGALVHLKTKGENAPTPISQAV